MVLDGLFEVLPKATWKERLGDVSKHDHLRQKELGRHYTMKISGQTIHLVPRHTDSDRPEITFKELYNLKILKTVGATIHSVFFNGSKVENPNLPSTSSNGDWSDI